LNKSPTNSPSVTLLPCSLDTLVWPKGSTLLELAESMRNRVAAGRQVPESNSICVHASSLFSCPPVGPATMCADAFVSLLFNTCIISAICQSNLDMAFIFPARMQVDIVSARSWILAVLGESRYHRSMPVMHVLHLFLQPSQSKTSERKPAHFPTRSTPWNTKPSLSHISRKVIADSEAESELGDSFTANATRDSGSFLGVRAVHIPQSSVVSCTSQTLPHRMRAIL
jgi:hypothetical protein